jgi:hypothetical protein
MSTTTTTFVGDHHVLLRVKGSPAGVELFHSIIAVCDNDWPYLSHNNRTGRVRVCTRCLGAVWHSPRLAPGDLKAAARQAGISIKIRHFAPTTACKGTNMTFDYTNDIIQLSMSEARDLYAANGVTRFRDAHRPLGTKPTIIVASTTPVVDETPKPILLPGFPSTDSLIAEVIAPAADPLESLTHSACQSRDESSGGGGEGWVDGYGCGMGEWVN